MSAEANLAKLGITLPEANTPVANYVPCVQVGELLFVSGHGPTRNPPFRKGRLGRDLTIEQGREAARDVGVAILATMRKHLGSLDRVVRLVKVLGMVNSTPDFFDHPKVMNGFSDLMVEVFGENGRHARSAVGFPVLPGDIPVEIEVIVQIKA
jgi:enamine deaminase RidA (YjgF/YER057c/UK114 family)